MPDHNAVVSSILEYSRAVYRPEEYPALGSQLAEWRESRPLAGVRILDSTPLFANTLLKFVPLLAAGAELTAATHDAIPCDPAMVPLLDRWGIPHVHNARSGSYDCILDCAGAHAGLEPRSGFAELTRSGYYHYRNARKPVILVDDSRIKAIETCLGTGEGFLRAMKQLGYTDFKGRRLVIFGFGKVGRGIAFYARREGASIEAVDEPGTSVPAGVTLISLHDRTAVTAAVRAAWCVVTATGIADAMNGNGAAEELLRGSQLVAAMGVENEWGDSLPPERILNRNVPLNFLLDEPTRLRYIDPTMALSNAAAVELVRGGLSAGVQKISPEVEQNYWRIVERDSMIADEVKESGL
ncbi:MAG: hypothetical protein IJS14_04525 [Lentisphaeria bacterium]|nr:hypothetical protein [Lentisphaeria bacterium]